MSAPINLRAPRRPSLASTVTFVSVRAGCLLVDGFGQVCRVESVTGRGRSRRQRVVVTRRRDGRLYWDSTATWTPEQFDARSFRIVGR